LPIKQFAWAAFSLKRASFHSHTLFLLLYNPQYSKIIALLALTASASAFAPASFGVRTSMKLFRDYGEFNGKMWDTATKTIVYDKWDPSAPRTVFNFNPFETWDGNSPDASGIYPGETGYLDPLRGEASFTIMMEERALSEARAANPKAGDTPGCPGCRT
jgi:hypothetical protein